MCEPAFVYISALYLVVPRMIAILFCYRLVMISLDYLSIINVLEVINY